MNLFDLLAKRCEVPLASGIIQLWTLRVLVPLGAQGHLLKDGNDLGLIGKALGIAVEHDERSTDVQATRLLLKKLHLQAEERADTQSLPEFVRENVARIGETIGLSDIDCRILEFIVLLRTDSVLEDVTDALGALTSIKAFQVLSIILGLEESSVRDALSADAPLIRSGLIRLDCGRLVLHSKFDLLSARFADYIISSPSNPLEMLKDTVAPCPPAQLKLDNYDHLTEVSSLLTPYLRHSVAAGRRGVNIFIYGPPGTGKSQLARALATHLDFKLFEIASEDRDGDPIYGERRLRSYRLAQNFFAQKETMIVFDEVEDIFGDGSDSGRRSTAENRKAWINKTLEENQIPTLWLSNSLDGMDNAFVRRFDLVLEVPVPPKKQREKILRSVCKDLLNEAGIQRISESESLAPAVVGKAAGVVNSIAGVLDSQAQSATLEMLINSTLKAQGHKPLRHSGASHIAEQFDPLFIQADADVESVAAGLKACKSGRLCLYGPPGTGKTAYGRWLAEQLDMPLLVRRGSDLMSMWVGGNERNIAAAFRTAQRDGALLLIDEVDSFLSDRRGSESTWQLGMVNEMLTQMENFEGVFVASTNLMAGLDQASLRRFDLKVKFDYLNSDQSAQLLRRYCRLLGLQEPDRRHILNVCAMRCLTPGDFAAVHRQSRFRPLADVSALVAALEIECSIKQVARPAIGFLQ